MASTASDQIELVREAESSGFDSVWTAEAYGSDAATPLAWFAAQTERIRLGAAILQIPGRSPAMTAMTAVTIDHLSNGRFTPRARAPPDPRWPRAGTASASRHQLARTREYVEIVRKALARERLTYSGEQFTLPLPDGPGKALKLMIDPVQDQIPIYIAAIGPKNTRLVGEIADGWLPVFFSPEHVGDSRALLEEGAARARRARSLTSTSPPPCRWRSTTTSTSARDVMRPFIALYVGGMGSRDKNFYNQLVRRYGFEDAASEIQQLYLEGKKQEAAAAIPPELIDQVTMCGPREQVRERLEVYREAGVGTLIASVMAPDPEARKRTIRELAEML